MPGESVINLEKALAQHATNIRYSNLPTEVVEMCKRLLIDTLACGFGAVGTESAVIAEKILDERLNQACTAASSVLDTSSPKACSSRCILICDL